MSLIVLIGAQAVGKMTVGKALEERIEAKLLYNHQTIDIFAQYLGYTKETFRLSDQMRKALFRAFVAHPETNTTESLIFTVMIDFDAPEDRQFLREIAMIFLETNQRVYFVELAADVETRLSRNIGADRLAAKPSKRDLAFSRKDLLHAHEHYRLVSFPDELAELVPEAATLKIDNTNLSVAETADQIKNWYLER